MKKYEIPSRVMPWLTALTLGALAAGCGGGGAGGQAPILGGVTIAPVAPMVTAVTPLPNASGVPVNTKVITAAFTKAMDPGTLTTANFTLTCPGNTPMTGTSVSYFAAGRLASLTLPAATNLPPSTLCTATVTSAVKDSLGIAIPSNFVWRFTTNPSADTTPPMVNATINANGAANVATNTRVGVSFTEALDPVTVNTNSFTLRQGTTLIPGTVTYSGVNAVFRPNVPLANNTTYSARISGVTGSAGGDRGVAVRDVAGNSMLVD